MSSAPLQHLKFWRDLGFAATDEGISGCYSHSAPREGVSPAQSILLFLIVLSHSHFPSNCSVVLFPWFLDAVAAGVQKVPYQIPNPQKSHNVEQCTIEGSCRALVEPLS